MGDNNKIIYLILGLGIGIIMTNMLHSFYPKFEYVELSEEAIIERARDLGMIKLKESIKVEKDKVDNEVNIEKDKVDKEVKIEEEPVELKVREVIVEEGSGLTEVAKQLYNADLIDDMEKFILFVRGEKLDKKIIIGKHEIKPNSSYSEIIKMLTDRNYEKD